MSTPSSATEDPPPTSTKLFKIVEEHDVDHHHLRVLEPATPDWLERLAEAYRTLRTGSRHPLEPLTFDGLDLLDLAGVQAVLTREAVPEHRTGNFAVTRSDFGEVILGVTNTELYGARYGYRSTRDRELISITGRGIDQIGVEFEHVSGNGDGGVSRQVGDSAGQSIDTLNYAPSHPADTLSQPARLTLVLGEAKVSSDRKSPPQVVDTADDCLRVQHIDHLTNRDATVGKVWNASRFADDSETQQLLRIAAELLRKEHYDRLRIVSASVLVRPEGILQVPSDFGTFHSSSGDFDPAHLRFLIIRLPADVETLVSRFTALARGEIE